MFSQKFSLSMYKRGLGKTLLSYFLAISLLPVAFIGITEYYNAKNSITKNKLSELSLINLIVSREFDNYRRNIIKGLKIYEPMGVNFIQDLENSWKLTGSTLKDYLQSAQYEEIVSWHVNNLKNEEDVFHYKGIVLGDSEGNILYSVHTKFIGEKILDIKHKNSNLSKAVIKALNTGKIQYSDQEFDEQINDTASFFVIPLTNSDKNSIGFFAVKVTDRQELINIFDERLPLKDDISAFMVGIDGVTRFYNSAARIVYGKKITSPPIEQWAKHFDGNSHYVETHTGNIFPFNNKNDHIANKDSQHNNQKNLNKKDIWAMQIGEPNIMIYINHKNEKVVGVYSHIKTFGHSFLLLSEVAFDHAFMPIFTFRNQLITVFIITGLIVLLLSFLMTRRIVMPVKTITLAVNRVASGDFVKPDITEVNNEIGDLSKSVALMTDQLREVIAENKKQMWLQEGLAKLSDTIRSDISLTVLSSQILNFICRYLKYPMGAIYIMKEDKLHMLSSYAYSNRKKLANTFSLGEGLPGQAALEKKSIIISTPEDFFSIESALGSTKPHFVLVLPLLNEGEVIAIMEFAMFEQISESNNKFFEAAKESLAIAFKSVQSREQVQILLEQTTAQKSELQAQQDKLQSANFELEKQTNILLESEEELKAQSEELQRANVELEETTESLCHQKAEIEKKNSEIEISKTAIEEKAQELEEVSQYKSEFLANMSHELRTPLNSMLILSRMLADNEESNLSEDQVESAEVIDKVGHDLLRLINDILDLSKVESGKLEINIESCYFKDIVEDVKRQFSFLAEEKSVDFNISVDPSMPEIFETDYQRLMQIIKNLLSNAFKFTERGTVSLNIYNGTFDSEKTISSDFIVAFSVKDNGIGIPKKSQKQIFEAFKQADGSTSRKYGGTGLGLSISREMAHLLNGEIHLESEEGKGSTFTLYLPITRDSSKVKSELEESSNEKFIASQKENQPQTITKNINKNTSDNNQNGPILIIEDDQTFLNILVKTAKKNQCECITATNGENALKLARHYHPRAIILDLGLPDMDGSEVLEKLKSNTATQSIPIHIISGKDQDKAGTVINTAVNYFKKPISENELKHLFSNLQSGDVAINTVLIADADIESQNNINSLLITKNITSICASTGDEVLDCLKNNNIHCLIIDVDLPEGGAKLLSTIHNKYPQCPPIILNSNRDISKEEYCTLAGYSGSVIISDKQSKFRLLDEVMLFIHSVKTKKELINAPMDEQKITLTLGKDELFDGKKILLVDDDIRNTFALSKALKKYKFNIILADNGQLALDKLAENNDVSLVLMDIMMPIMDGYEAIGKIREQKKYDSLPIIALTAKAMQGDKAKCLDAGANDYMTKPVNIKKLISMIQLWLQQFNA